MLKNISVMSPAKANRLYWLGRYAERVYLNLHLLRRTHDLMIDGEAHDYEKYYENLGAVNNYPDNESAKIGFMYDINNPNSIISGIEAANDNAIVLRNDIMSETLSYVQMSLEHIRREAQKKGSNITDLQCITDWMLAFWGSIEERVYSEQVKFFLQIGKLVEHIDMNIRFDYKFYRIEEAFFILEKVVSLEPRAVNMDSLKALKGLLTEDQYNPKDLAYKFEVLSLLNGLVLI